MLIQIKRSTLVASLALALVVVGPVTPVQAKAPVAQMPQVKYDYNMDIFHPVIAHNGMVATEQHLASAIGLDILKKGGNAVDAAVGIGFALAVALPNAGNLGGGGFMMVHDKDSGQTIALDFREMAPAKASRDMYLDEQGNVAGGRSLYTHLAVGVPGTVAGMEHALKKWGSMPLEQVIQPAIDLAENGYIVSNALAENLAATKESLGKWDTTKAIFFKEGEPLKAGDLLAQKDLAASMRLIAKEGAAAFYQGAIADQIVEEMAKHDGLITKEDLANYKVVEREPVKGTYRGYEVVSMPPPSSGGIHVIQILNMLEGQNLNEMGHNSAKAVTLMTESMKRAYADRSEYLGDPDFTKVPQKGLTSKGYANSLVAGMPLDKVTPAREILPGKPQPYESDQTTHYSVVDKNGNAVAVTYTLNLNFGSGIVAGNSGILLNNEMDDFSAKPGVPNAFGLIGGDANAVGPGKRPLSSMTPTLVLKDGKPWLVTGSPGGARIITTVLQTIVNSIDFGMNPAEAASAPRFHHQWLPDELRIEKGFSPDTLVLLKEKGYEIALKPAMGRTQTIQVRDNVLYGYSDPRNPDGVTIGY
ncbi:gamma-glutamyltransferase [Advenella faeciporci]|uniref:Glutathione hydrolase proenzyme n=1 Tax=Advenella faeciporci TaxID=797535 RepID=A0A918N0B2_9BURK|nr:gamma-glutamyltransferase [Advenella faeciporci]